jgi:hypothetical protein
MALIKISARLNAGQLKRAQKLLATKTATETIQKALDLVTQKVVHDEVIRRYSGAGAPDAFKEL